jgi:NAD-dependent SIR2 family protein deacetylase
MVRDLLISTSASTCKGESCDSSSNSIDVSIPIPSKTYFLVGLSQRANHPREQLKLLHGTLFDIKCFNSNCNYVQQNNYDDPFDPLLAIHSPEDERLVASKSSNMDGLVSGAQTSTIDPSLLPHCPKCTTGLLRPAVVWFGEALPKDTLNEIDEWMDRGKIDLIMVIGTTATVWPAAGYVEEARARGARVAVVNMDGEDLGAASGLGKGDFLFVGDAAEILPQMVKSVTGDVEGEWQRYLLGIEDEEK